MEAGVIQVVILKKDSADVPSSILMINIYFARERKKKNE
jgi:hypothetical protein